MPARSLMSRPSAANASTVPELSVAATRSANWSIYVLPRAGKVDDATTGSSGASSSDCVCDCDCDCVSPVADVRRRRGCSTRRGPADAVRDQRVAGEQREQQQPLENAGERFRQAEARLGEFAADVEHAHQDRRKDDPDRMQATDEGDDDRGESVAGGNVRRQLAERAGDLEPTGEPRHRTGEQQRRPERLARRKASVARRRRRQAADLKLEAGVGAKEQDPERGHGDERAERADVDPVAAVQARHLRRLQEGDRLREVVAVRVLPRPVDEVVEKLLGDVDEHQADEDLVGVEAVAQQGDDRRPEHAAEHAAGEHRQEEPVAGVLAREHRDAAGGDRADDELPFGADVPDVGAKAHRQAERDQQQRRRLDRELGQRVDALHRLDEEDREAAQRVLAEENEQAGADDDRDRERDQRRGDRHRPRRLGARLKPEHGSPRRRGSRDRSSIRRSARPSPGRSRRRARRGRGR